MSVEPRPKRVNGEVQIEYLSGQNEDEDKQSTKCSRCQENCLHFCQPVLAEQHPLSPNAKRLERFRHNFYCPPHSRMGAVLFVFLLCAVFYGVLWSITGLEALPGGNLFGLFVLFFSCWCGGYLLSLFRLPPLLGMLLVGGILGNVPPIDFARNINTEWAASCRQIALTIILIRAGLGLDPAALRRLSFVVIRLAFSPCLAETIADGIGAHLILGFPWQWGFMLGFIISAVSPAVVVPSLLSLSERGYGLDKGIPTLVIAAASIDDVLAITGFGVLLGITFSSGNLVWNIFKGPLEAIVGVAFGIVGGVLLWYFPQKKSKHLTLFRTALLVGLGLFAIFGSKQADWSGAGPLAVLTLAFVAAYHWRHDYTEGKSNPIEFAVGVMWMIFQPLLFGLIAAEVQISELSAQTVGEGVAVLCIGLVVRCFVAFLAVFGTNFNIKERLFIPIAWMPKATVQAAIGAIAYDMARQINDEKMMEYGEKVLVLAVLVIVVTAPLGALGIFFSGPRFLKHCPRKVQFVVETSIEMDEADKEMQAAKRLLDAEI